MIEYAEWMYRPSRPTCDECIKIHNKRKDEKLQIPDCKECGYVDPLPGNYQTLGLVNRFPGIFVDGMGGINPDGIRFALDVAEVEDEERNILSEKLLIYLKTSLSTQRG